MVNSRPAWVVSLLLVAGEAAAADGHVVGEDVRVEARTDGSARVVHAVSLRVLNSGVHALTFGGWDDSWRLPSTAALVAADGRAASATTSEEAGLVRLTFDAKGLKRGDYRVEMTYDGPLHVTHDGAFERLRFALPPVRDGVDGVRVTFVLPPAPTEPRLATDGDALPDTGTLRRYPDHDELEVVRPHVPKGDPAVFQVRVDPRALAAVGRPEASAVAESIPAAEPEAPRLGTLMLAALAGLTVFALGLAKARLRTSPRRTVTSACAGLLFGAATVAQQQGRLVLGAALMAGSILLLVTRMRLRPLAEQPFGTWLVLKPEEAFALRPAQPADLLDATTPQGRRVLACVLVGVAVLVALLVRHGGLPAGVACALDALVLVPLFFSGTSKQVRPPPTEQAAWLAPAARALAAHDLLRVAPLARVTPDGALDEVRLLVCPRLGMPGLSGIEVGIAWEVAGGALVPWLDVLARVQDGTSASARMTVAFPQKRALPGRKPEERVFRFDPRWPTIDAAVDEVLSLAEVVRDRRMRIDRPEHERRSSHLGTPKAGPNPPLGGRGAEDAPSGPGFVA